MEFNDKVNVKGHFKLTAIDRDGTVDVYEDKNLIMDKARSNMAELVSGWGTGKPISKFLLGTKGHNPDTGNVLDPIQVGSYEFAPERTEMFSVQQDEFFYTLEWDPFNPVGPDLETNDDGSGGIVEWNEFGTLEAYAKGNKQNQTGTEADAENAACPIRIDVMDRTIKYTITIPELAANGPTSNGTVAYTEACLIADDDIFSMKTYACRVKESTVKYILEWSILF